MSACEAVPMPTCTHTVRPCKDMTLFYLLAPLLQWHRRSYLELSAVGFILYLMGVGSNYFISAFLLHYGIFFALGIAAFWSAVDPPHSPMSRPACIRPTRPPYSNHRQKDC